MLMQMNKRMHLQFMISRDDSFDLLKTSRSDYLLVFFILAFSFASIYFHLQRGSMDSVDSAKALVTEDQKQIAELDLNQDQKVDLKTINNPVTLEIRQKKIRMLHSRCPKHICMNTGWISRKGQTIICLPNKIIIEIISEDDPGVDAVVY
jgi:hypothetical protein